MGTLVDDLKYRKGEIPDRTALFFGDDTITFLELWKKSVRVADALRKKGITSKDKIFVFIQNSFELVETIYGIHILGATCIPFNIMWRKDEILEDLQKMGNKYGVTNQRNLGVIQKVAAEYNGFVDIMVYGPTEPLSAPFSDFDKYLETCDENATFPPIDEEGVGLIIHTGGTSGEQKAAVITHGGYNQTITNLVESNVGKKTPLPAADASEPPSIIALPLFHGGGLSSFYFAIKVGRSIVIMEKFEAVKFAHEVEKHNIKNIVCMPSMVQMLANEKNPITLKSLKYVLCTGGALTGEVQKQFMDRFGVPIGQNYGSTEAGHVAGTSFRDIKLGNFKPGAVGRAYKGVELKIVDAEGKDKPRGESGEIVARSGGSMKGYLKKEGEEGHSAKDDIVKEGWVYTGDLGYIDDDGYLFIVGRERDIIKAGGFQVSPLELEDCLLKMEGIKEVAVVGVKDARMGELPKAFVVLREGAKLTEEEIINFSKDHLAKYKMIRAVAFVDSLPKNDTGKVLKRLLV